MAATQQTFPQTPTQSRRSDCTAGQMDGEAGWWTTIGNIGLPPLARVMGVGRQQQGRRPVGRPRKSWLEIVEADMAELEIDREHFHDRKKWRKNVMLGYVTSR